MLFEGRYLSIGAATISGLRSAKQFFSEVLIYIHSRKIQVRIQEILITTIQGVFKV